MLISEITIIRTNGFPVERISAIMVARSTINHIEVTSTLRRTPNLLVRVYHIIINVPLKADA